MSADLDRKNIALPALSLYFGNVMHARLKPKKHRFNYRVFSTVIDLDHLVDAGRINPLFSVNSANILSFHEKDHGPRDGSNLREYIDSIFEKWGRCPPTKILLWCNPRVFGYTFNPLSIYFCYDENGNVSALVYQVHNTFGQDHSYVADVDPEQRDNASIRQSAEKKFYVSPFLDMDLRYDFRINEPGETLRVRILEHDQDGPILSAAFSGEYRRPTVGNLLAGIFMCLGLTWKIMAGIHFEALLLWCKGIKLRKRPAPPEKLSYLRSDKLVAGE